ncbi:MAG: hypothetical protein HOL85_14090, partial [Rhodospirillaceae bacterium]|nr:hypothetical protein [Rhodospirillaceae bacterium]
FVIHSSPRAEFLKKVSEFGAIPNKFGGFGLRFHQWKVDVWHLEDTWARTAGLKQVDEISDILACTFFDWDSIVFDLSTGRLIFDDQYLRKLAEGIMDIQLQENPNPRGSLVRALRRAAAWNVKFGPTLTKFCHRYLELFDWSELVELDRIAFNEAILTHLDQHEIIRRLANTKRIQGVDISHPVPNWEREPELPLLNMENTDLAPTA